ncbi:MAG: sodium-independent anion transporter [Gaiellaceae bacterium]
MVGWVERSAATPMSPCTRRRAVMPGVVVYRLDDRLFFTNARYVKGRVREAINGAPSPTRWLVFDAEAVTHVDATGLEALSELTTSLRDDGVRLVFARLKPGPQRRFEEAGLTEAIGPDRFYPTIRAAVNG